MQVQPTNIVQFIFVFQMVFGALLIWKNARYRGLTYLLLFSAFAMLFNLAEELGNTREIYLVTPVFLLGKGALLYLFVYQLVYPEKNINKAYFIHLAPLVMALPFTHWPQWVIGVGTLSQVIYAVLAIKLIWAYQKASYSMRSDADSLQLNWLIKVIVILLALGAIDLVRLNMQPYLSLPVNLIGQFADNASILLLFSFIIYKAVHLPQLFTGMSAFEQTIDCPEEDEKQIDAALSQTIFDSIHASILANSLHHKPRLSLNDLSQETGLNTRDVSRAINQSKNVSFCDYINQLRVDDLKDKLHRKEQNSRSILELAFEVGFNSKSSFNTIFKREVGQTPTQYINTHCR